MLPLIELKFVCVPVPVEEAGSLRNWPWRSTSCCSGPFGVANDEIRARLDGQPTSLCRVGVRLAESGTARLRAGWNPESGVLTERPVIRKPCGRRPGTPMFGMIFFGSKGRLFVASMPSGPLKYWPPDGAFTGAPKVTFEVTWTAGRPVAGSVVVVVGGVGAVGVVPGPMCCIGRP